MHAKTFLLRTHSLDLIVQSVTVPEWHLLHQSKNLSEFLDIYKKVRHARFSRFFLLPTFVGGWVSLSPRDWMLVQAFCSVAVAALLFLL